MLFYSQRQATNPQTLALFLSLLFFNSITTETVEEKTQVWRCISDPVHRDATELAFYTACPTQKEATGTHWSNQVPSPCSRDSNAPPSRSVMLWKYPQNAPQPLQYCIQSNCFTYKDIYKYERSISQGMKKQLFPLTESTVNQRLDSALLSMQEKTFQI